MTDQDLIRVCAELEGWKAGKCICGCDRPWVSPSGLGAYEQGLPNYPESHDAIIALIQKLEIAEEVEQLVRINDGWASALNASARQLTIATVKAVGKFKE